MDRPEEDQAGGCEVITDFGDSPEAVAIARSIYEDAIRNLAYYAPNFSPTEPSVFLCTRGDEYGGGEYLGILNGRHYLEVGFGRKPEIITPEKRELLTSILTHELIHQKQFEQPEVAEAFPSLHVTATGLPAASGVMELEILKKQGLKLSRLQAPLIEGAVVYVELDILHQRIAAAKLSGDVSQLELLEQTLAERTDLLGLDKDINQKLDTQPGNPYKLGYALFARLVTVYGGDRLLDVVRAIDYQACSEIEAGSERYQQILDNPRLIPGLEQLSAE